MPEELIKVKAKKQAELRHDILNLITVMKGRYQKMREWHQKMKEWLKKEEEWGRAMEKKAYQLLDELHNSLDVIEKNNRKKGDER